MTKGRWIAVMVLLWSTGLMGQRPYSLQDQQRDFNEAVELYENAKFAPARKRFETYLQSYCAVNTSAECADAEYYIALAAMELYHKDAEFLVEKFIRNHPDSPRKMKAYYQFGVFYGKKKSAKKCLEWMEKVDPRTLTEKESILYHYYLGQSYWDRGEPVKARKEFLAIKDNESVFQYPALYNYSHLTYEAGDYSAALVGFELLKSHPKFKEIVPPYIAQIYYVQQRYDELIAYSEEVFNAAKDWDEKKKAGLQKLVGDAYFNTEQYAASIPFLHAFIQAEGPSNVKREDVYRLGYAYMRNNEYALAMDHFKLAKGNEDELGQLAAYNEGCCAIKLDQKHDAMKAFSAAKDMEFNAEIQEDAMFNFAKISFELSSDPFDDAITSFESYLTRYPTSPRRDEAYNFLLNVYMKTRNYEKALASLEKIQRKDNIIKAAYQNLSYNRGVELYQSREWKKAEQFFMQSFTYPIDEETSALSRFWLAEISYARSEFPAALERYSTFLAEPGAFGTEVYGLGYYGMGYCRFKLAENEENEETIRNQYGLAQGNFKKYLEGNWERDKRKMYDAYLRVADVYYFDKEYEKAIVYYDKVADDSQGNKDYAMYQKAMAYGFLMQPEKKSWVLKTMLTDMPNSKFEVDAIYELAKSYLMEDRLTEAKTYYNTLLTQHPNSAYSKRVLVDQCLLYAKLNDQAGIKKAWNALVKEFPNDKILNDALAVVKPYLIEDADFQDQIRNIQILNVSTKEIEDDVYAKASSLAFDENCEAAVPKLKNYIQQFQNGLYAVEAHYLLAQCLMKKNDEDGALDAYNYVIAQPTSDYSEDALYVAASINYKRKAWDLAAQHYAELEQIAISKNNILEAQVGLMRCFYYKGEYNYAKEYADKVIDNTGIPEDIRNTAYMWRAKMSMEGKVYDLARQDLEVVISKGGKNGAEAQYLKCVTLYDEKRFADCELAIIDLIDRFSGFEEWKNKGFVLLVDSYIGMEDFFQARATIEAIEQNVTDPTTVTASKERYKTIDDLERAIELKNKPAEKVEEINITPADSTNLQNPMPHE